MFKEDRNVCTQISNDDKGFMGLITNDLRSVCGFRPTPQRNRMSTKAVLRRKSSQLGKTLMKVLREGMLAKAMPVRSIPKVEQRKRTECRHSLKRRTKEGRKSGIVEETTGTEGGGPEEEQGEEGGGGGRGGGGRNGGRRKRGRRKRGIHPHRG